LKALPNLKTLNLQGVEVTPAEVEKLRAELPAVKIEYKPLTDDEQKKLEDFLTHK